MKKNIFNISILVLLFSFSSNAQNWFDEDNEKERKGPGAMKTGEFMVTFFGSYPNFGRFYAQRAFESSNVIKYSTRGISPTGIQLEYMLSRNLGYTVDAMFDSYKAEWQHSFLGETFNNSVNQSRTRLLFGLNYHIDDVENEKFSFYAGAAIGMNFKNLNFSIDEYWSNNFFTDFSVSSPLAYRARTGIRFFPKPNIGLNVELGAGGPVMRFGLTYRFTQNASAEDQKSKM